MQTPRHFPETLPPELVIASLLLIAVGVIVWYFKDYRR